MLLLRASWLVPIVAPPVREGWVAVEDGRIAAVGGPGDRAPRADEERRLAGAALMPGLVNAHTHLELSYLRGDVGPAPRFTDWIRQLMHLRRTRDAATPQAAQALERSIAEAHASGTAIVGDVSNTLASLPALERSPLAAHVFFELLRFRSDEVERVYADALQRLGALAPGPRVRVSLAPHAPYSVAPRLFSLIRRHVDETAGGRTSVHLCESAEECELLATGTGRWRELLQELDVWDAGWVPPATTPVEYLDALGFLRPGTLVVHGVHMEAADLERLRARDATLVTCPRSNRHVGVGEPPLARFYAAGVQVAVGTDSLTSVPDLNVFAELAEMRRLAPRVAPRRLLESATRVGARALGFEDHGALSPGASAALIAVDLPRSVDVEDVEESLVGGIVPEQVRWPLHDA